MKSLASALHLPWRALRFFSYGSLVAASLNLTGCFHPETPAGLVIINFNDPESLDPAVVVGISEMRITKALFEGLLRLDPKTAEPTPGLAERWSVSADGRVYTFYLRTNAAWSTGELITSEDLLYSWLRALSPATAGDYAGQLFYIKNAEAYYNGKIKDPAGVGIHALNTRTIQVELDQPVAFFLDLCTFPTLAVVPRQTIEKRGDRWLNERPLPCSGPYELVDWRLNDKVLVPVELLDLLMKRPDFHSFDYLGTYFYRFNVNRKPFDDPRVRKAFALVTDKERIVNKITKGGEKPAAHFVPEGVARYQSPPGLGYNLEQARKLLAEAGFPGGRGFPRLQYSFYSAASGG